MWSTFESPLGPLLAVADEDSLRGLHMLGGRKPPRVAPSWRRDDRRFEELREQLEEYFRGERREFDLRLDPQGPSFDRAVWDALTEIPYGETRAYGEIARRIGHADQARAVGAANGRNPIAVVIPCHRVIGADGSLVGYGGGLARKRLLLDLEAPLTQLDLTSSSTR